MKTNDKITFSDTPESTYDAPSFLLRIGAKK
jgi:hypothetical protein